MSMPPSDRPWPRGPTWRPSCCSSWPPTRTIGVARRGPPAIAGTPGQGGRAAGRRRDAVGPGCAWRRRPRPRLPRDGTGDPGPLDRLTREVLDRLAARPRTRRCAGSFPEALADLAQAPRRQCGTWRPTPLDLVAVPVLARSPQLGGGGPGCPWSPKAPRPRGPRRAIAGRPKLGSPGRRRHRRLGRPGRDHRPAGQWRRTVAPRRRWTGCSTTAPAHPAWHAPLVRRPEFGRCGGWRPAGRVRRRCAGGGAGTPGPAWVRRPAAAIAAVRPAGCADPPPPRVRPLPISGAAPDGGTVGCRAGAVSGGPRAWTTMRWTPPFLAATGGR